MEFIKNVPYPVQFIQADEDSESMAEFEYACKTLKIPLIVLPSKRPIYNGEVERGNEYLEKSFAAGTIYKQTHLGHSE